jgi:AraC-like DNA-binding protein
MTTTKSTNKDDYQDVPRPIGAMPKDYPLGYVSKLHSHRRAQFLHATAGIMEVEAGGRIWIVPPGLALWLPPRVAHEIRMHGRVSLRTLYIEPDYCQATAPSRITLMRVSSLLRELIERACALPIVYETSGRAGLTMALIMQELEWLDAAGLPVLKAEDSRLRTVVESILADPGLPHALNGLARMAGASPRTIARLCRREFGMSFDFV